MLIHIVCQSLNLLIFHEEIDRKTPLRHVYIIWKLLLYELLTSI